RARVMLEQDADEALHRADDGAMQHHRMLARAVLVDELGAQQPRHVEIDLHRSALPEATDRVLERILDLGPVEGALSRRYRARATRLAQRFHQRVLGLRPQVVGAYALVGTRRDLVDDL